MLYAFFEFGIDFFFLILDLLEGVEVSYCGFNLFKLQFNCISNEVENIFIRDWQFGYAFFRSALVSLLQHFLICFPSVSYDLLECFCVYFYSESSFVACLSTSLIYF